MEDEDYFKLSDDIFMYNDEKLHVGSTSNYLHQRAGGIVELKSTSILELDASNYIDLQTDSLKIVEGGDTDIAVTFNANSKDGVLTWMEDED